MPMKKRGAPSLTRFPSVVVAEHAGYYTPILVFLRRRFGRARAFSAQGHGHAQFQAVLVDAPLGAVKEAMEGRNGVARVGHAPRVLRRQADARNAAARARRAGATRQ